MEQTRKRKKCFREGWEEKLPRPSAMKLEHPRFQEMIQENYKLILWVDRRLRRNFNPYNLRHWPEGYFVGFLVDLFNRMLYSYDPERSKLGHYFNLLAHRHVIEEFLQYESESWHEVFDHDKLLPEEEHETNVNFAYYESMYNLYRIPEKDDNWARDVIEFFPATVDALEYFLGDLSVREKNILLRRFIHEHTLHEIGKDEKITKERVRQIQERALGKIRDKIRTTEDFKSYLRDVLYQPLP